MTARGTADPADLARAWVSGWVISRHVPAPVPEPWGLRIDVGLPKQVARHVLFDADETTARKAAESITTPHTWIKTFVPPETITPWLTPDWTQDAPGFLMSTDLRPEAPLVPAGYTLTSETRGGVIHVRVLATDGSEAPHGQIAPTGALYESLGWRVHARVTGFVYRADPNTSG
ncbi:hypothetical protein SRB5_02530 [Streptomyces sp. RB5]|uniref:Uncharacterized protein n=1 Tax=Streptomyces smaragdinus TaxID=2585196 RepID=A0A7K0C9L6_9ACTN|nr:GNAT family N-acetyltransferase [Streptomyces smaragdinus]MQY10147.1 hypothetical protein [Streptomyces smaragdinus]